MDSIFGTDGIRALTGEYPLTPEGVRSVGLAAAEVLRKKNKGRRALIIGKDTRGSGGWIEDSLSEGLLAGGCEVLSCGVIPTSAVAALLRERDFLGGAVISASHNPPQFNGIKFFASTGHKIPNAWEAEIEKRLSSLKPAALRSTSSRQAQPYADAVPLYLQFLKGTLPPSFSLAGLRWVVDCANGSASSVAAALFRSLGADVTAIHARPNGKNINEGCGALHPETLQAEVKRLKAHGGCAFDGDADRVQFVDEQGRLMDGDVLIGMAAQYLKETGRLKGNWVVTTVMANLGFMKEMKRMGVRVAVTAVGDRAVSDGLKSKGAVLGGEQSGHIIFNEFLPTGDGLLTALQVLRVVVEKRRKLSHFEKLFPKYPQILVNLKVKRKVPIEDLPALRKEIAAWEAKLDGDGRILIRYSGTEPLLRIMVEGDSHAKIRKIADSIGSVARSLLD